jgi:SAM-dependent MidA family methyltransferase
MEMALYYPGYGYYTSPGEKIGKEGDYYTSPFLTSLFGAMIVKQLEEMWLLLGQGDFTVVEYGAGTGILCRDILKGLINNTELYDNLHYCIIERSDVMQEKEKETGNEKLDWYKNIQDIPRFPGVCYPMKWWTIFLYTR